MSAKTGSTVDPEGGGWSVRSWLSRWVLVGSVVGAAALASAPAASADVPCGSTGVFSQTGSIQTCTYTGAGTDTFTVPSGISSLDVVAIGAAGGTSGGAGASVEDTAVPVTSNDVLGVTVGGVGADGSFTNGGAGGSPGGGGAGGDYPAGNGGAEGDGGGGGGYSGLFDPSSNPLVIAGGGGGGGGAGGAGGAGDTGSGGGQGVGTGYVSPGGGGGTGGGPGLGGAGASGAGNGSPGSSTPAPDGAGGQGGVSNGGANSSGGGGGGGYFGGGGGGGAFLAAGGGGGASFGVGAGLTNETNASASAEVVINFSTTSGTSLHASAPATGSPGTTILRGAIGGDLSGGSAPTGAIVFRVFGPQSTPPSLCSSGGTTVGTPVGVSGDGRYHPNADFTPSAAGDYWWYASYSGDSGNTPAASPCGGAMPETIVGGGGSTTPSNTAPPTISGTTRQGKTLTESHGAWTVTPTGYSYQWFDCSSTGGVPCTAISGATGQSYKLTSADVGHTIRVLETAQFASSSGKAVSAPTAVVSALSVLAPQISKFKIRSKHHSAKFTFSSTGATGYECALIRHKKHKHKKPHYTSCSSPQRYTNLKPGNYTFKVKALGTNGATTTSTTETFTI